LQHPAAAPLELLTSLLSAFDYGSSMCLGVIFDYNPLEGQHIVGVEI
jgi:hypothetical protein